MGHRNGLSGFIRVRALAILVRSPVVRTKAAALEEPYELRGSSTVL